MLTSYDIGQTFIDSDGDKLRIIARLNNGNYVAVMLISDGRETETVMVYDHNGEQPGAHWGSKLVGKVVPGVEQWSKLESFEKDALRAFIVALRDKKITCIKYLRAMHGWSLLEAKNIFEGVVDGRAAERKPKRKGIDARL